MLKNGFYTVFVSLGKVDHSNEILLVETTKELRYKQALKWAKENKYFVTREYLPNTILEKPKFI